MVATMRATVPTMAQIPEYWQVWFQTVAAWLHTQQIPIGVPIAFHHDEGFQPEQIDTECGFIIPTIHRRAIAPPTPIVLRQLEAHAHIATVAVANPDPHTGGLKNAYAALGQWISTQGYTLYGAPREVYYGAPETGDVTVEIQFPVEQSQGIQPAVSRSMHLRYRWRYYVRSAVSPVSVSCRASGILCTRCAGIPTLACPYGNNHGRNHLWANIRAHQWAS